MLTQMDKEKRHAGECHVMTETAVLPLQARECQGRLTTLQTGEAGRGSLLQRSEEPGQPDTLLCPV